MSFFQYCATCEKQLKSLDSLYCSEKCRKADKNPQNSKESILSFTQHWSNSLSNSSLILNQNKNQNLNLSKNQNTNQNPNPNPNPNTNTNPNHISRYTGFPSPAASEHTLDSNDYLVPPSLYPPSCSSFSSVSLSSSNGFTHKRINSSPTCCLSNSNSNLIISDTKNHLDRTKSSYSLESFSSNDDLYDPDCNKSNPSKIYFQDHITLGNSTNIHNLQPPSSPCSIHDKNISYSTQDLNLNTNSSYHIHGPFANLNPLGQSLPFVAKSSDQMLQHTKQFSRSIDLVIPLNNLEINDDTDVDVNSNNDSSSKEYQLNHLKSFNPSDLFASINNFSNKRRKNPKHLTRKGNSSKGNTNGSPTSKTKNINDDQSDTNNIQFDDMEILKTSMSKNNLNSIPSIKIQNSSTPQPKRHKKDFCPQTLESLNE